MNLNKLYLLIYLLHLIYLSHTLKRIVAMTPVAMPAARIPKYLNSPAQVVTKAATPPLPTMAWLLAKLSFEQRQ